MRWDKRENEQLTKAITFVSRSQMICKMTISHTLKYIIKASAHIQTPLKTI